MVGRHSHKRRRRKTTPTSSTSPSARDEVVVNLTRTGEASPRDEDPAEEDTQLLTEFTDMLSTSSDLTMLSLFNWDAETVVPHSSGMSAPESTMAAVATSRPRADSVFVDSLAQMDVATTDGSYSLSPRTSMATTSRTESGRGELPATPFSTTTAVATVTSGSMGAPAARPGKEHETSDSRMYTLNLLNAITSLEAEMDSTSCSVDRCMDVIKTGTKEIQRAVQSRQWQRSVTGPVLVQVATEIALITMEKLAAQWRDGDDDDGGGGGGGGVGGGGHDDDRGRATGRSLHLGQYSTESDEASFIWRQVVLFEARRLQQLVRAVGAKLDRSGRCHSGPRPEGRLKLFCADQEERLSNLISTLLRNDMMAG